MSDEDAPSFANGPNTICFTCAGFKKISEPRLYLIQATEDTATGMTLAEWRECPTCKGHGILPGIVPPM